MPDSRIRINNKSDRTVAYHNEEEIKQQVAYVCRLCYFFNPLCTNNQLTFEPQWKAKPLYYKSGFIFLDMQIRFKGYLKSQGVKNDTSFCSSYSYAVVVLKMNPKPQQNLDLVISHLIKSCTYWIFFMVATKAKYKQCIIFLHLMNFNLVNDLYLI